ncbi:(R)-amidase [Bradyrhizobium sp. USDA 3397]
MIMSRLLTIALAQIASEPGNTAGNLARALECVARAATEGAQLLLLPELHLQGYRADDLFAQQAETIPGPAADALSEATSNSGVYVAMGMARRSESFPHAVYNSVAFAGPGGSVNYFDKVHPATFHPYTEGVHFAPGNRAPVFETPFGRCSLQICYDAFFPELARHFALQGSELNLVISAGPRGSTQGWDSILRARSIENLMWTVYCNAVGQQKDSVFAGGSKIVSPAGDVIAEAALDREDFLVTTIDLEEVGRLRRRRLTFRDVQMWLLNDLAHRHDRFGHN